MIKELKIVLWVLVLLMDTIFYICKIDTQQVERTLVTRKANNYVERCESRVIHRGFGQDGSSVERFRRQVGNRDECSDKNTRDGLVKIHS